MDASHQMVNFAGGSALIIPSTAKHPQEAMAFMLWLTDVEAQRLKYGLDPGLGLSQQDIADQSTPANRTVASDPALAEDPLWKDAINQTPPRTPGISPVYSQIYQVLADMQERVIRTNNDLDTELAERSGSGTEAARREHRADAQPVPVLTGGDAPWPIPA